MDEKALRDLTRRTAERLFGKRDAGGTSAYALWREFDPELARQLSMFYTGRLHSREVLTHKERELCTVAALTVLSCQHELALHCAAALNVGATAKEVAEVMFQMGSYGGAPCTVEALRTLKQVLCERGEWKDAESAPGPGGAP